MCELKKLLNAKGYSFIKVDGVIKVTHQGYVDLRSLTSITTDVKF